MVRGHTYTKQQGSGDEECPLLKGEVSDWMNIYDVAQEAGVSIATVSRVVNGKSSVSIKTREKVEAVLKRHNYSPSEIARGLVLNSIRTVGIMAMDIRDVYYANVAYTVEQELSKLGYTVILCNTGEDTKEKIKYMSILMQKKVDGIILVGSVFKDASLEGAIAGIADKVPIVMINGFIDSRNVYSVICDDSNGISQAVDHLLEQGRKKLIYLQDTDSFSARSKVEGFRSAMKANNMEAGENNLFRVKKGLEGGYEGIAAIVRKGISFDAAVCGDDLTAIGAIRYMKDCGRKVPDDAAVIGYNNSVLAHCCDPLLTSIDSRMFDMGRTAIEIFSKVMDQETVNQKTYLQPRLCKGKSG